nr:hypothetical protein Iba_chr02aCG8400 [Ipomoea batatas]
MASSSTSSPPHYFTFDNHSLWDEKTVRGGRTEGSPGAASVAEARRYCRLLLHRRRFAVQTGEKAFAELQRHRKLTIATVALSRRAATTAAGRTEEGDGGVEAAKVLRCFEYRRSACRASPGKIGEEGCHYRMLLGGRRRRVTRRGRRRCCYQPRLRTLTITCCYHRRVRKRPRRTTELLAVHGGKRGEHRHLHRRCYAGSYQAAVILLDVVVVAVRSSSSGRGRRCNVLETEWDFCSPLGKRPSPSSSATASSPLLPLLYLVAPLPPPLDERKRVTGVLRPPRCSAALSTAALPVVRRRGKQGKKAATTACCLEDDAGGSHEEGDVAAATNHDYVPSPSPVAITVEFGNGQGEPPSCSLFTAERGENTATFTVVATPGVTKPP